MTGTTTVTTVTSQANPLAYMKAIATLIGSIVTGLLGVYTADTPIGQVLTVVAIIATAIATWVVPNAIVVPATIETDTPGLVEVNEADEIDDGLTYEESGGHPYPRDDSGRMNAVLAIFMAVLLTFTGMILTAPAANAYITNGARVSWGVNTSTPTHIDYRVVWNRQHDGTGVFVDWFGVDVTNCAQRFGTGAKYSDVVVWVRDGNTNNLISVKNYGVQTPCNLELQIDRYGYDEGYVMVLVQLFANTPGADPIIEFQYNLWPSGGNVCLWADYTY